MLSELKKDYMYIFPVHEHLFLWHDLKAAYKSVEIQ